MYYHLKKKDILRYIVAILVDTLYYNPITIHYALVKKWGKCCLVRTRMNRNNTTMTSKMNTRPKNRREGNATRLQPGQGNRGE